MTKLFAVINGRIIKSLEDNTTPTYTRIHYLLRGLEKLGVEVKSIAFSQVPRSSWSIFYNNIIKTAVAFYAALILILDKPIVYFAYPHSIITIQNKVLFKLSIVLKLKIILDIHDTMEQAEVTGAGKSILNRNLEASCIENATLILALNRPMWERLMKIYNLPPGKNVVFISNAYEEEFIALYPNKYESVAGRFNICYVGGITQNRGVDLLVQACKRLHGRYPYLKLYLYGTYGANRPMDLKKEIDESGFIVRREVPRREIPRLLLEMDLLVMPYNPNETYMNLSSPTKFFEYLGTGKPIICTKCESLLEFGEDGGILYTDYSETDLESKVELLINDPRLREALSEKVMKMRPFHTWDVRANVLHEAIKSL